MKARVGFTMILGACLLGPGVHGQLSTNLLVNANGEAGSMSGWEVTANGGNGWHVGTDYGGVLPGSSNAFETSYDWDIRSQTIDLLAAGFTAQQLDDVPTISISEWVRGYFALPDYYFINVQLQDAGHNSLSTLTYGSQGSPMTIGTTTWTGISTNLSDYGTGLRYIVFQDGGKDTEYWADWYGAAFDGSSVTLQTEPTPEPSPLVLAGLGVCLSLSLIRLRKQ